MPEVKEGLTVYHRTPEPPRVPYPEPIKVSDPLGLRRARIKTLFHILQKKMELAHTMRLTLDKIANPELRQIIEANYRRQLMEIDEVWLEVAFEMGESYNVIARRLKAMTGR